MPRASWNEIEAGAEFLESTLADQYDSLTMPPCLANAHTALDRRQI